MYNYLLSDKLMVFGRLQCDIWTWWQYGCLVLLFARHYIC